MWLTSRKTPSEKFSTWTILRWNFSLLEIVVLLPLTVLHQAWENQRERQGQKEEADRSLDCQEP